MLRSNSRQTVAVALLVSLTALSSCTLFNEEPQPIPADGASSFSTPAAVTEGMAFDGSDLWVVSEGNSLTKGDEKFYKVNPVSGDVLTSIDVETLQWPHGLTYAYGFLWVVDEGDNTRSGDERIIKINPQNGNTKSILRPQVESPAGLTFDGTFLWLFDLDTHDIGKLLKLDIENGDSEATYSFQDKYFIDLAFDGTYLWAADTRSNKLYKIDPDTGNIVDSSEAPGREPYASGLTFGGGYLWFSEAYNDKIYRLQSSTLD